jgi:hypothetical protein
MNYTQALDRLNNLKRPPGGNPKTVKSPLLPVLTVAPGGLPEKTPALDTRPPCERGRTPCDNSGQETRYCREHCRPAWEREAAREKPSDVDPTPGPRRQGTIPTRGAWRVEIETVWPEDYREGWLELVQSYRHAGHPRGIAEHGAYLDLAEGSSVAAGPS